MRNKTQLFTKNKLQTYCSITLSTKKFCNTNACYANRFIVTYAHGQLFVCILQESQYAMIALIILCIFASDVPVQAQTPCSISRVNFYPQTAYAGQMVSIISQVIFTCGPSYNYVWKVQVYVSNSAYNITSTNSVQSVYASYANTAINVTDSFTAPPKEGLLSLDVHAYIMTQSGSKIFASWSSTLKIQVQPVAATYTTTTSTPVPITTTQPVTRVTLTTSPTTQSGFSLSTGQIYMILTIVLSVLFIIAVAVRIKQTLRKDTRSYDSLEPGPT